MGGGEVITGSYATHVVCISEDEYLSGVQERLRLEGKALPPNSHVEVSSIVKQVAVASLLTGPVHVAISEGQFSLEPNEAFPGYWLCTGWSRISSNSITSNDSFPLLSFSTKRITADRLRSMMAKLDRYYRSGMWWHDRLGMSLAYFFAGVCTRFPEQAYLSLTTALESLLTTQRDEITHSLAERVATLLGKDTAAKVNRYRQVKRLYKTRSQIVHGKVFPKKGPIHTGSLFVGPKWSNVPREDMESILELTVALLRRVLGLPSLLKIIHVKQKEDKTDQAIDEYFLKRML